jgi:integrase
MRYVTERRNASGKVRRYWQRRGHGLVRLPDDDEAMTKMLARLNREADGPAPTPAPTVIHGTVRWCINDYRAGERWAKLAKASKVSYGVHLRALDEKFPRLLMRDFDRSMAKAWLSQIDGIASRNLARYVLHTLYEHAIEEEVIERNPILKLRLPRSKARDQYVRPADWDHLVSTAADAKAPAWFVPMMALMLYTAQRVRDALMLQWPKDGEIKVRQKKTRALVAMPVHERLAAEIAKLPKLGVTILRTEANRHITYASASSWWTEVKVKAGLEHLQLRDFRRTAVVMMAEAGCSIPQIASITGHTIGSVHRIIETYWVATKPQADAAIGLWERYNPGTESNVGRLTPSKTG